LQRFFDLFTNHMLTKGRNEVLDPSGDHHPVWIGANKTDCVTQIVTPQPGVAIEDQNVVCASFHILQSQTWGVFFPKLSGGDKLKKDTRPGVEQHALMWKCVLKCDKTLRSRIGLHAVDPSACQGLQLVAVGFKIDSPVHEN